MSSAEKAIGLDQALEIWRRRKWPALLVFGATLALFTSLVEFLPDVYRSTAVLLIESQQVPQEIVRSTVSSAVEKRVQKTIQAILSRAHIEGLINSFGLYAELKPRFSSEEIIERMRTDISLEFGGINQAAQRSPQNSNVNVAFAISYQGSDAQKVAAVTNTLASYFIEEDLKSRERQAGGTTEFLKSQIEEMKSALEAKERQVSEFRQKNITELPTDRGAALTTLERLNADLLANGQKQVQARARRTIFDQQLADLNPGDAASQIGIVMERAQELAARLRAAEGDLRALVAEDTNLRKAITSYRERLENGLRREQELQELSRDRDTTQEVYGSLLKRYEEAKVSENLEQRQKGEQFRVLDPAIPSERPAAPNRPRLLLLGLAIALAAAGALVAVTERLDTSFRSAEELRVFSRVRVLAAIPRIVTVAEAAGARRRFRMGAVASVCGLCLIVGGSYLVAKGNQRLVNVIAAFGGQGK